MMLWSLVTSNMKLYFSLILWPLTKVAEGFTSTTIPMARQLCSLLATGILQLGGAPVFAVGWRCIVELPYSTGSTIPKFPNVYLDTSTMYGSMF